MVSRRNFFTMLTLLMIMVFMFMFSSVLKQVLNEYGTNSYAEADLDVDTLRQRYDVLSDKLSKEAMALSNQPMTSDVFEEGDQDKRVLFLSKKSDNEVGQVVASWCEYMKRPMITYYTVKGLGDVDFSKLPEVIIADGEFINWDMDGEILCQLASKGTCIIFARMPRAKEIERNPLIMELMGIKEVYSESIAIDGIRLFPGFFVGTEEEYAYSPKDEGRQDLNLMLPWYVTGEGSKVYMMGVVNDRSRKSEDLPSIVWRHAYGSGKVFCICGDYLTKESGIGFITACMGEKDSYDIYPVINAQNLVLANYGGFSDENAEKLDSIYDQRQVALFRDIVWPNVVSMTERTKDKISLMVSPQMDYDDDKEPEEDLLIYYLRLLNEGYGEAGLSSKQLSKLPVADKLGRDRVFWQREASDYTLQSLYLDDQSLYPEVQKNLPELRTVVVDKSQAAPVSYLDGNVTCQVATSDALTYTFSEDLLMKSYETALGYSNVVMDMSLVSYPAKDDFSEFSRKTSSNLITYWKQFSGFEKTTLSQSDERIRRFFALDYYDGRKGEEISLHVDGFDGQAFFILKLNRDVIDEVTGATIKDLKNGFYLLDVSQEDVVIKVKERWLYYY
ncbi:MAG: DUF2194 domain-containing protein [Lachnospiraceae bacterium]|nr:DUF2194 domain-containing protein [Lachnospiraceae bacterium]